jgi:hypothetical protein
MNKVIRDGKVAVLYSPGFGAGWYTWNTLRDDDETQCIKLIFDPVLVELVEKRNGDNYDEITDAIEKRGEEILPEGYFGGACDLEIKWLPVGTRFIINETDGSEYVQTVEDMWLTA